MAVDARTKLDARDRSILAALQSDASMSLRALGGLVGLSAAAVQRRIKRLRADGIITGDVALLDPRAARPHELHFVELNIGGGESLPLIQGLCSDQRVQQCYRTTEDKILLMLVVESDAELTVLLEGFLEIVPVEQVLHVRQCLKPLKRGLALPV